jgi:hypothetical protein
MNMFMRVVAAMLMRVVAAFIISFFGKVVVFTLWIGSNHIMAI